WQRVPVFRFSLARCQTVPEHSGSGHLYMHCAEHHWEGISGGIPPTHRKQKTTQYWQAEEPHCPTAAWSWTPDVRDGKRSQAHYLRNLRASQVSATSRSRPKC